MSVVSRFSDRVMVMYAGQIAEAARTESIFARPLHPYTRGLMSAFPALTGPRRELAGIPGSPPDLARPPSGCRFHPRCPEVMSQCLIREPPLYRHSDADVRCLLYEDQAQEVVET
jgi:peptide/nickel transport system ATP-binding protein